MLNDRRRPFPDDLQPGASSKLLSSIGGSRDVGHPFLTLRDDCPLEILAKKTEFVSVSVNVGCCLPSSLSQFLSPMNLYHSASRPRPNIL